MFDHLGLPEIEAGANEPGFSRLLGFGRAGAYIKLSGASRISREPFPHVDLDRHVEALLAAFSPDRRVWGSDWPFTGLSDKPDYAETQAMLARWLPDSEGRRLALSEVPARLWLRRFANLVSALEVPLLSWISPLAYQTCLFAPIECKEFLRLSNVHRVEPLATCEQPCWPSSPVGESTPGRNEPDSEAATP